MEVDPDIQGERGHAGLARRMQVEGNTQQQLERAVVAPAFTDRYGLTSRSGATSTMLSKSAHAWSRVELTLPP